MILTVVNSNTVGNGWAEIEKSSNDVRVRNNELRLRDTQSNQTDAAVLQNISTAGFTNIWLDFDWGTSGNTESTDKLHVSWDRNDGNWTTQWTTNLSGGSGFKSVNLNFLGAADDLSNFRLAFWTEVSYYNEYAKLDNIVLRGDAAPVPESATVALLGIGMVGLAGTEVRRRRNKKIVDNS